MYVKFSGWNRFNWSSFHVFLTFQKSLAYHSKLVVLFYRMLKLFLLINSSRRYLFSGEHWHSPAGGIFNPQMSNYNTVIGYTRENI